MTMDQIYHGCVYANADGTRKIMASGENVLVRTNKCFWKDPVDVVTQIKTHSMTKKELCVSRGVFNNYFMRKTGSGFDFLEE